MVSFFEDTEAQHAETSRPTSAVTPQHQPGYPLTRNSFISLFFSADALSPREEEDYCAPDKVFKLPQGQRNSCSR